jgi:hypothetical protein
MTEHPQAAPQTQQLCDMTYGTFPVICMYVSHTDHTHIHTHSPTPTPTPTPTHTHTHTHTHAHIHQHSPTPTPTHPHLPEHPRAMSQTQRLCDMAHSLWLSHTEGRPAHACRLPERQAFRLEGWIQRWICCEVNRVGQKRVYTLCMTVYLMKALQIMLYLHHTYI